MRVEKHEREMRWDEGREGKTWSWEDRGEWLLGVDLGDLTQRREGGRGERKREGGRGRGGRERDKAEILRASK